MKLICTMPVRNEDWVLGLTARAALMWCDMLMIGLHACTDRSGAIAAAIAEEHRGRVGIIVQNSVEWREMVHRQSLLSVSRDHGATHIAMVDADEILTGNMLPRIRDIIDLHCERGILNLPWIALARDPLRYVTGGSYWGDRQNVTMAFKDRPEFHWSSPERGGYEHHQRPPMPGSGQRNQFVQPLRPEQGGIMHLQFLSERRLRAKQALYQAHEVLRHPDNMLGVHATRAQAAQAYGRAVYESDPERNGVETAGTPAEWWQPYMKLQQYVPQLDENKEPWQENELKRLVAEHGRSTFNGLDFFGVA